MTPHAFTAKWRGNELKERSASQSHFNDLCGGCAMEQRFEAWPGGIQPAVPIEPS